MVGTAKNIDASRFWPYAEWLASRFFKVTHWQWVTFFVVVALALRLFLALTHENYLGIDGGAYVLSALEVQGKDATSVGFPRPPLAPGWLLVPFIELLGIDVGYKVWTALFSFAPILPVYLLARDLANKSAAAFAVAFFSVDMMQMEMMVTGALPQIGFACIGMALWSIFRLTANLGEWRHVGILALSVGILPYINQTSAGIAAILLPIATIALFYFLYKDKGRMEAGPYQCNIIFWVLPAALIGGLIALGALPWYLANSPGNSELRFPGPIIQFVHWTDTALLLQAPVVATVVYFLWKATRDYVIRTLALLIGVLGCLMLFLSWDEAIINILFRSRYMVGLLIYPAIGYLLCRTWPLIHSIKEEWPILIGVAAWLALLWGQVVVFSLQTGLKDMVSPQTVEALEIPSAEHPSAAIITNAYSLSHWVAALNQVESPNTWTLEPSPYYKNQAILVNCILGWAADCDAQLAAQSLNARYILIDERFPTKWEHNAWGSPKREAWETLHDVLWLTLRYNKGAVQLWEIDF